MDETDCKPIAEWVTQDSPMAKARDAERERCLRVLREMRAELFAEDHDPWPRWTDQPFDTVDEAIRRVEAGDK